MKRSLIALLSFLTLVVLPQSEWHTNVVTLCNPDGTTYLGTNVWTYNLRFNYSGDTNVWFTIYVGATQGDGTNAFYVYDPTNITIITTRLPKVIQNTNNNTWKIRFP